MLAELIYEDIPSSNKTYTFGKARYGRLDVVIMKENSYVNATNLCNSKNKSYADLAKDEHFKAIINAVSLYDGIPIKDLSIKIRSKQSDIKGIYVHQNIIVHVAIWASPTFATEAGKIVNGR